MTTNTDAAPSLLPCPFCGAPVSFAPYKRDGLKIECKPCVISYQQRTMRFDLNWLEEKMTEHWNRRAPVEVQAETVRVGSVLRNLVGYMASIELPDELRNSAELADAYAEFKGAN